MLSAFLLTKLIDEPRYQFLPPRKSNDRLRYPIGAIDDISKFTWAEHIAARNAIRMRELSLKLLEKLWLMPYRSDVLENECEMYLKERRLLPRIRRFPEI